MELKELEKALVAYYNVHQSDYVQRTAMRYIDRQFDPAMFATLLQAILKSHPFNYGFPDVAAIEEAHERHYRKDGVSLRKPKPKTFWEAEYEQVTEEQRKQSEEIRGKWLGLVKEAEQKKRIKLDDVCQKCAHRPEYQENLYCRGCIDHNKFEGAT